MYVRPTDATPVLRDVSLFWRIPFSGSPVRPIVFFFVTIRDQRPALAVCCSSPRRGGAERGRKAAISSPRPRSFISVPSILHRPAQSAHPREAPVAGHVTSKKKKKHTPNPPTPQKEIKGKINNEIPVFPFF